MDGNFEEKEIVIHVGILMRETPHKPLFSLEDTKVIMCPSNSKSAPAYPLLCDKGATVVVMAITFTYEQVIKIFHTSSKLMVL